MFQQALLAPEAPHIWGVCVCVAPLEADAFVAETDLPAPGAVG